MEVWGTVMVTVSLRLFLEHFESVKGCRNCGKEKSLRFHAIQKLHEDMKGDDDVLPAFDGFNFECFLPSSMKENLNGFDYVQACQNQRLPWY